MPLKSTVSSATRPPELARTRKQEIENKLDVVLEALTTVTTLLAGASSDIGVLGLSAALSSVAVVLKKIQEMSANIRGVDELCERLQRMCQRLEKFYSRDRVNPLPKTLEARVDELSKSLVRIGNAATQIKAQKGIKQFFTAGKNAEVLGGLVAEVNASIEAFLVEQGMETEESVHRILQIHTEMQLEGSEVYLPKDVPLAAFDANEVRGQCLEGTRTNLLDDYYGWITSAAAVPAIDIGTGREGLGQSEAYAEIVRWIYGLAGTGKTTFAWTIAKWCKDNGLLGGSFFCSGNADGCNEATSIFPTIALQLCRINDSFKRNVIAVMKKDKHIADSAPARQLEELILRPLEELQEPFPRLVLVVDALDQCRDKKGSAILAALSKFLPRISKFFLLVLTGRPEPYLTRHFESSRPECLGPATKQLDLYMVDQELVSNDIRLTLIHDLRSPEGSISGPPGWPDDEKIDTLTTLSHGLFIYARTAARWVMDATVGDPENRFERLVTKQKAQDRQSSTPQDLMDDIYGQIVSEAHSHVSEELEQRLQEVVGTIVLAEESLSVDSLAELLDLSNTQVRNTLSGLHSVLHVPADHGPVRVIHPTFSEFLARKESKKPRAFYIHPTQRHYALFRRCLIVMCTSLHYDILGTGNAAIFKKEITHLDEKIARYIKFSLSYACRHWGDHLSRATGDDLTPSFGDLEKFVRGYLLFWLEACSFLEALDRVLHSLSAALHFCQTHAGQFANLLPLISNFRQFALTYSVCIDIAPLQVYHSAMALAPKGTPITESYAPSPGSIIVHRGEMEHWDACLNAFFWFKTKNGEPAAGVAIAISTSGAYFATGGIRGGMKIWRTLTCNLVLSIDHPDLRNIRSLAFSPNDSYIASGLDDGTVHIWDAGTGARLRVLHCGDTPVRSITYHPRGNRILYAVNRSIGLRDTLSDQHSVRLDTCPGLHQVGLSPDGDTIAYGTENSLELYNIASKERRSFGPFESKVNLVTISPTGREVAACSRAVWVWNLSDNSQIFYAPLGEPIQAFQVAFSNDGARIGVACNDGSVRIWSVDEGSASLRTLLRHPQQAHDLVWSLDNCQIVSVGDDYSVHVWDAVQPNKHFVCDDIPFASESTDYHGDQNSDGISVISPRVNSFTVPSGVTTPNTISRASMHTPLPPAHGDLVQIEHAVSPTNTRELLGEFNWEFLTGSRTREQGWLMKTSSPDGTHDVWVSFDRHTVYILNVSDPDMATITINSAGEVFSMALSPNNKLLATGCGKEHGVLLYNTSNGSFVRSLSRHRARILSVAFSSDSDLVISGSKDRTIEVYSISRDDLLGSLGLHQHAVTHVAFVQDDKYIISQDHWFKFYIWRYEGTKSTILYESALTDDPWLRSLWFPSDDSGIGFLSKDGTPHTVSLWTPGHRVWPTYNVTKEGWVYAMGPGYKHRLGWLIPAWRHPLLSNGLELSVLDTGRRRVVELGLSGLANRWEEI